MIFYFIRHGDPVYSPNSLTELGKRQAEAAAKRLAQHGIDEIYASTSNRALQTALPLSELVKKPIIQLDWCNEDYAWEEFTLTDENGNRNWLFSDKKTRTFLHSREITEMGFHWSDHQFFHEKVKEGIFRIDRETDRFLEQLGYLHDRENARYNIIKQNNKRIALFAHQGFSMAFLSSVLDIPYPVFASSFDITHTGISVIYFPDSIDGVTTPTMLEHSNDSHLYKEGLPTRYNNQILI